MEFWLKRYLGLFFNFEYYGILNWLAFPLLIYFFITIKRRKKWEMAVVFVLILSCISLEIKGGFWTRYILTIYPFILTLIFLSIWEIIKKKSLYFQICIFTLCGAAVLFNYYHFRDLYKFYWSYKIRVVDDYFPHNLLEFINNIEDLGSDSAILICSQRQIFYYYSNKKGIDYRDPQVRIFNQQQNKDAALGMLKNQLKIKYIYLHSYFKPNLMLADIISNDCDLAYQDKNGFYLYRLRERDLNKEELDKLFTNESLLKNGSLENWSHGPLKKPDYFEGGDNVFDGMVIREEKEVKAGKYSAKITGDNFNFAQDLSNFENYKEKTLTCFVWVKTNVPNKYRIQIYDGIKSSFSRIHKGNGKWELLQANYTVNPLTKFVTIRIIQAEQTGNVDDVVYVDGALLVEGDWNTFYMYKLHMIEKTNIIPNR